MAIRDWEPPVTGEQMQSSLICYFYSCNVRHVAELTGPLEAVKLQKTMTNGLHC